MSPCGPKPNHPPIWKVVAAFTAVYTIWGSTYLGIRFAVESIPPFLMGGSRFLAAGTFLYLIVRLRGAPSPSRIEWRDAAIAGALMLTVANGLVGWAEQVVPSGVAAVIAALVPLWMVLFDWLRPGGLRPRLMVFVGLALGILGIAVLVRETAAVVGHASIPGVAALVIASVSWAAGSVYNRYARKPGSILLAVAMQMIAGSLLMLLVGWARGETADFSPANLTGTSALAWLYLIAFGSLIGYTAYVWLLGVSVPARVSTYAYVNPIIAVILGCTLGREAFSSTLFTSAGTVILAVAIIVRSTAGAKPVPTSRPLVLKQAAHLGPDMPGPAEWTTD